MDVSSFVLLSHEQALRRQLDITANNMANTNTVGYKREQALFHEYVETVKDAPVQDARKTSFVLDFGAVHDTAQGAFQSTGNPLDVMIDGPGYLNVETPEGGVAYTRAGFVKILSTGELASSGGQRLLDQNGQPITIPADQMNQVSITEDGSVMAAGAQVGRLAVTSFADENMLEPRGDGMLTGTGGRFLAAAQTKLKTGGVEASNVEPIKETTNMVEILRSYQTSQRLSADLNDMRKRAIDRLSRVS
ncbi:flagellar hook-basal body complex protein [Novosphingobium aerophilum]|uniref:flagellar hook-basal body complex protein n=1 Tax=Novosphingobium TaxID=165696 RepID=UPI0006C8DA43|nr:MULTISPECIES: flagellar hook-basal body complex protein [unclassified Novosphingobium]KPH62815.1 flagellar basal-body rod protein FlgF [Novosphingobium sp. ST904]MPS71218.1 flagellar hook-basal body complex protein [Novosphingobium sp.]TCM39226.1 flagellar basal-body rod protein FlgF [Novosphingobium sp. ST904]WRT92784.1 flagellar hook-basal body complex protein [Novosphingobium sp. RL4]